MFSFQPVTLDTTSPDSEAALVFRSGRLVAVLTRLSDIHADLGGKWFLEAAFANVPAVQPVVFETMEQFGEWLSEEA